MNDEIKEILESLDKIAKAKYYPEDLLTYKECQLLLDYITNLQELYNEEIHKRIKAHNYIFKNMICDALYPASKVDGENIINILNGGDEE